MTNTSKTTNSMVKGALLLALAFVLTYLEFAIIPGNTWLKLDFSAVPILVAGLAFGPTFGLLLTGLLQVLVIAIQGTTTGGVGQIANLIMVGSFVFVASFMYKRNKTTTGLIIGLVLGTITLIVAGFLANKFILLPLYIKAFFGGAFPGGDVAYNAYLYQMVPLFNLIKGVVLSVISGVVYSRLGSFLNKEAWKYEHMTGSKKTNNSFVTR
ncbi:MAG: ECF transporter S component [Clostridiaceae bacterium]